jgi:steroid delta-isomerase-like uncharacterized protein
MDRRLMLARAAEVIAAWNRGDADGLAAAVAEDVIWRDLALKKPMTGREEIRTTARVYLAAFPDLRVQETSSTVAGPRLAQELTITGTHRGELLGIAPTGRWTESYAAVVLTFDEDGTIIEGATDWNALAMLCQLGLTPPLAAPAAA